MLGEASDLFALESKFCIDPVRDFTAPLDTFLIAAISAAQSFVGIASDDF
jgi:hypothetical protein